MIEMCNAFMHAVKIWSHLKENWSSYSITKWYRFFLKHPEHLKWYNLKKNKTFNHCMNYIPCLLIAVWWRDKSTGCARVKSLFLRSFLDNQMCVFFDIGSRRGSLVPTNFVSYGARYLALTQVFQQLPFYYGFLTYIKRLFSCMVWHFI